MKHIYYPFVIERKGKYLFISDDSYQIGFSFSYGKRLIKNGSIKIIEGITEIINFK